MSEEALRIHFEQECADVDRLLMHLGLDPARCRSEGGRLLVGRTITMLEERGVKIDRGRPVKPHATGPAQFLDQSPLSVFPLREPKA